MTVEAIVDLADVHKELSIPSDNPARDDELQVFIDGITAVVEEIAGPVIPRDLDEFYDGGSTVIMLRAYPVIAVSAVTEYTPGANTLTAEPYGSSSYSGLGYRARLDIGKLTRTTGGYPRIFAPGSENIHVTYTAGRGAVPAGVKLATLELIRIHWQPERTAGPDTLDAGDQGDFDGVTVLGYMVPNRVLDMLGPDQRAPRVG